MKGELRKREILDCAKRLFSRKGYYNTHVEDVLREAGIGKGTFYQYFKNKEDLFIALLVRFLDEWEEAVLSTITDLGEKDLREYYRTLIRRSFVFFRENEDLCNIYLRVGPGTDEVFEPYIKKFEEKMLQYVKSDLSRGVTAGTLRNDIDIELMANILLGAFLRIDYYYFVLNKKKARDIDEMTDQFYALIRDGILTDAGTAARTPAAPKKKPHR